MSLNPVEFAAARKRVNEQVPASAAIRWPLLEELTGTETWVKHENHNPTGAFKVRGGINLMGKARDRGDRIDRIIAATRGNHGQSAAYAARAAGVPCTIVVPEGNSPDKNAAMRGYGAELIVHGHDFQEAREHAATLANDHDLMLPAYHPDLVEGVATLAVELHEQVPRLEVIYVPVGMGTNICGNILVRDLLGIDCEIVGVVAENAPCHALSFEAGQVVNTESADTWVDGVATRSPVPEAVAVMAGASRFVRVDEASAKAAVRETYLRTHNLAEPAGALALAGMLLERNGEPDRIQGKRVGLILTGGNADYSVLRAAMESSDLGG